MVELMGKIFLCFRLRQVNWSFILCTKSTAYFYISEFLNLRVMYVVFLTVSIFVKRNSVIERQNKLCKLGSEMVIAKCIGYVH